MATALKSATRTKAATRRARKPERLDRGWKPTKAYVVAVTFENGDEAGMYPLYSSLRQARSDARYWSNDPCGDGVVSARVRRVTFVKLADPEAN